MMIWAAIFSLTNSFRISLSNSFCSSFNLLWTQRIFYGNWWIRLVFLCEPFASRMFLYPTEESQHGCSFFYDNLDNPKIFITESGVSIFQIFLWAGNFDTQFITDGSSFQLKKPWHILFSYLKLSQEQNSLLTTFSGSCLVTL